MRSCEEENLVIVKLDDGEDLFRSLGEVVEERRIKSGLVISGIGMLRNFELGYFDGKEYRKKEFNEPHELLTLQGSITTHGERIIHVHASLADRRNIAIGGHLFKAEVCSLNEIVIRRLEDVRLTRRTNPRTGLKELELP